METASPAGLGVYNHETDRRALLALFDATGGAGWKKKTGWEDNSDDLAAWYGVSVKASSGRVYALTIGPNNLNGALPPEIWDLTELEQLDVGCNHLRGDLPPIPENRMEKLYWFNVGTNKITGNLPNLHLLPSLEEAYLDTNRFIGSISENIGRCRKLRMIFLFSNKLEGKLPSGLGNLVNLIKLRISDNGFSGVIPEECVNMAKLREFKVDFIPDLTKPGNARVRSHFNQWIRDRKLEEDLAGLPFASSNDEPTPISVRKIGTDLTRIGEVEAFPGKDDQGMLFEGPLRTRGSDCLGFGDYAEVLANRLQAPAAWPVGLGIYAQWGAGKSSLCEMIIQELPKAKQEKTAQVPWFIRWLWRTTGGAALYALTTCLVSAVSARCCLPTSSAETDETNGGEGKGGPGYPMSGRCCGSSERDIGVDNAERGDGTSASSNPASPPVKSIVASFNAWLFADSKVLWAVLVSKIFEMEDCFGKGAVRATRLQHAVSSSTCMDWCTVVSTIIIVICVVAAVVWVAEQINHLEEQAERVAAGVALAGAPTAIVLLVIKALHVVFKSQGEIILSKAEAMGESVGAARLGFMAEVQEEMQVLLGMLESKSSEDMKYLLVVSIDNLDRCPHRQIIRVLEAVHLLLEHNKVNVAVILALDPRLIIAAIEKDMEEGMCREVSGSEYLDKIIHWPFCIPGGTKKERRSLLHNWLRNQESRRRSSYSMLPAQDEEGAKASEGSADEGRNPQSTHGRPTNQSVEPSGEGDAKAGEESAYEDREPHSTPTRRGISSVSSGGGDDLNNATEVFNRSSHFSGAAASVNLQGSHEGTPSTTTARKWTSGRLGRQTSYRAQTSAEVKVLEKMITGVATTPRKAKRVCNIYSIQRELAMRRANKTGVAFSSDDALKLLRWTIMSEFWPFHTACIAAIIPRERGDRHQGKTTLQDLFNEEGEAFLLKIFGGKDSKGNAVGKTGGESSTDFDSSSRIIARRLIGMDEEYEGFSQLLGSHPKLAVADFEEKNLGLLRLSINLNPAMVARVTTWSRSKYEFNG